VPNPRQARFGPESREEGRARVERGLQPIAANAMHFHSLKHSIAMILASRVDNIHYVKTHLGRAAITSTMQYCHPNQKLTGKAVKAVLFEAFAAV
jgi:site-specific recombinase XerC